MCSALCLGRREVDVDVGANARSRGASERLSIGFYASRQSHRLYSTLRVHPTELGNGVPKFIEQSVLIQWNNILGWDSHLLGPRHIAPRTLHQLASLRSQPSEPSLQDGASTRVIIASLDYRGAEDELSLLEGRAVRPCRCNTADGTNAWGERMH